MIRNINLLLTYLAHDHTSFGNLSYAKTVLSTEVSVWYGVWSKLAEGRNLLGLFAPCLICLTLSGVVWGRLLPLSM